MSEENKIKETPPEETPPEETPPEETPPEETPPEETPPEETPPEETPPEETPPEETPPAEIPKFELKKIEPEIPEGEEETFEIIHNGQPYKFTKEKLIALAQKGFDYDVKVGPHGKLVQMVDADPELATTINDYWQRKIAGEPVKQEFKIKPITDYEDESEWLQANLNDAFAAFKPKAEPVVPDKSANPVADALTMRDPEYAPMVLSKIGNYAGQLTVADFQTINSDMGALCQFYDYVKKAELGKRATSSTRKATVPGFKVKSGGGDAPNLSSTPVWNLSKEAFQKQLDKIKGIG